MRFLKPHRFFGLMLEKLTVYPDFSSGQIFADLTPILLILNDLQKR